MCSHCSYKFFLPVKTVYFVCFAEPSQKRVNPLCFDRDVSSHFNLFSFLSKGCGEIFSFFIFSVGDIP